MAMPDDGSKPGQDPASRTTPPRPDPRRRWYLIGLLAIVLLAFIFLTAQKPSAGKTLTYNAFLYNYAANGDVKTALVNNSTGVITGKVILDRGTDLQHTVTYTTNGPAIVSQPDMRLLKKDGVPVSYFTPTPSLLDEL